MNNKPEFIDIEGEHAELERKTTYRKGLYVFHLIGFIFGVLVSLGIYLIVEGMVWWGIVALFVSLMFAPPLQLENYRRIWEK